MFMSDKQNIIIKDFIMKLFYILLFAISFLAFSCNDDKNEPTNPDDNLTGDKDRLYVKFVNNQESMYTITSLQYKNAGLVTSGLNPTGEWSDNLLKTNQTLKPGEHTFFLINIPRQYWAVCRIGVYDSVSKQTIFINDQPGFSDYWIKPTMTHWGGDSRTVKVTLVFRNDENMIVPTSWSDWTGIEE